MRSAYIKYIAGLIIFGSNGVVASHIALGSAEIIFFRSGLGALFLIAIFAISRKKSSFRIGGKQSLYVAISGAAMGASWTLLFEAYQHVGVSVATLAYYTGPVIVMIAARFVFKERLTVIKLLGLLAVIAGMVCVNGADVLGSGFSLGLFYGLMAAAAYAVMVICSKKAPSITGIENAMWQMIFAFLVVAIFIATTSTHLPEIPADSIPAVLFLGLVNGGFACYLYFSSLHKLSAQTISICGYIEPLSALLFSAAFLGERLTIIQIIGAVLILGGAALGEVLGNKRITKR